MKRGSAALLGGITLLGALLRFWSPGRIGYWRDEAQLLNISALPSYGAILDFLRAHESHPPLMYFAAHLLGTAQAMASRVDVVILCLSIAAIPLSAWVISGLGGKGAGPVAAGVTAICWPVVLFSVQIRPYALLAVTLLLSVGALLRSLRTGEQRWNALWLLATLITLYTHHVGILLLAAQATTVALATLFWADLRALSRRWAWWLGGVIALALPDLLLLSHQAVNAGHLAPSDGWRGPWRTLLGAVIAYPTILLLPLLAAPALALNARSRGAGILVRAQSEWLLATCFLATVFIMTVAGYRTSFLMVYLIMMLAPFAGTLLGLLLSDIVERRRRIAAAVMIELLVVSLAIDAVVWRDFQKVNTDLAASYVEAEAAPHDLVILGPGALGASFNYYFRGPQSQLDLPFAGPVTRYPFDDHFRRIADLNSLHEVYDSAEAAVSRGASIWLIMPANWLLSAQQPETLAVERVRGLGQADGARINLIRQYLAARIGEPRLAAVPHDGAGMELLVVQRFSPSQRPVDGEQANAGHP